MSDEQNTVSDEEAIDANAPELSEDDLENVAGGGPMKDLSHIKS